MCVYKGFNISSCTHSFLRQSKNNGFEIEEANTSNTTIHLA